MEMPQDGGRCLGQPAQRPERPAVPPASPYTVETAKTNHPRQYRVGTLTYTTGSLVVLFGWLLGGDFCFHLMESIFPSVLPIMLNQLSAPNWLVGLFITTIPSILNATVCPAISFISDRHRGPLGRRIPFILYTIPFLCAFLILIGQARNISGWLVRTGVFQDEIAVALVLIGVFVVGFQFFNMFVASVYYYLFNDVVPRQFLGRFLAAFRLAGVLASSAFYFFIFPHAETNAPYIFLGVALLYGVVFAVMCFRVKEGEYPEAEPFRGENPILSGLKAFFQEGYTQRYYWLFYLTVAFWAMATTGNVFLIFFAKSVGLTIEQFGLYTGGAAILAAVLLLPCGALSDKFRPIRTLLLSTSLLAGLSLLPLVFLVFPIEAGKAFPVWCVVFGLSVPVTALFFASEMPIYMQLLPREKYGQFCASTSLVRSVAAMIAGVSCGLFLDGARGFTKSPDEAYRYLPIWFSVFQGLSAMCLWLLYREWKRRGGDTQTSLASDE